MEPINKDKPLTALEKLQADKLRAKAKSDEAARRLNDNFTYIQDNSGRIILSSVSEVMLSGIKQVKKDDVVSLGATALPQLWGIARPILVAWGIGKVQSFVLGKLFSKKKGK